MDFLKYLRASYKTKYHMYRQDKCYVCGKTEDLELHHNKPLAVVVENYLTTNNIKGAKAGNEKLRNQILEECRNDIYGAENLITLCKIHHKSLHNLFGRTYNIQTSIKVKRYLERQKEKFNG